MSHKHTVLIVGGGGREHAIAWKLAQSPLLGSLYAAPGNAGIAELATCVDVSVDDLDGQVRLAQQIGADLVVIGPELPLSLGLVDRLEAVGIAAIGPAQAAARIESSKQFAKQMMQAAGIPTASYHVATDMETAESIIEAHFGGGPAAAETHVLADACDCGPGDGASGDAVATPIEPQPSQRPAVSGVSPAVPGSLVVKADGLAAGKGVVICHSAGEALAVARDMLSGTSLGGAGATVVFEQFLTGPEVSLLVFCDGEHVVPMPLAQDYKRLLSGDGGPNTGGMGSISPVPGCDDALHAELVRTCVQPLIAEMARRSTPFKGILFAGLMLTPAGPMVLEYNARFGDPETQSLLRRLDSDLLEIFLAMAAGDLSHAQPVWSDSAACCVVMAARGYPDEPERGVPIGGVDTLTAGVRDNLGTVGADSGAGGGVPGGGGVVSGAGGGVPGRGGVVPGAGGIAPGPVRVDSGPGGGVPGRDGGDQGDVIVFHGGTARDEGGRLVSAGGRVLSVTAVGDGLAAALDQAYAGVETISFPGSQYRRDIGRPGVD